MDNPPFGDSIHNYKPPPQQNLPPHQHREGAPPSGSTASAHKNNVSLYVCDIPQNIQKDGLESLFKCFEGFNEVRMAKDKNR